MVSYRESYDKELEELRKLLEAMCAQVEHNFEQLFEGLESKNQSVVEQMLREGNIINDMERKIESKCLTLITRQQPIASDLRKITTALKVVGDLERVGNHVVDMAELLLRLGLSDLNQFSLHLSGMVGVTQEMIHNSVDAFIKADIEAARQVIVSDDVVDCLFDKVKTDLAAAIRLENKDLDACIDMLMFAKYLEKIGDHGVNIGDWTIFQETGNMRNVRLV